MQLLRRATFDLIGLPPAPAEIDEFLKDESADAHEKMIDRLLQSDRKVFVEVALLFVELAQGVGIRIAAP